MGSLLGHMMFNRFVSNLKIGLNNEVIKFVGNSRQ